MDRDVLSAKLREWVEHDVMPSSQADAVWQYELAERVDHSANPAPRPDSSGARTLRVPVIGEVLGYIGSTLALTALAVLVAQSWDVLGTFGQIGVAALVTAACLGGGWFLSGYETPAARRLANFLLFLGTGAAMFLFGLIADKSMGSVKRDAYPQSQTPEIVGSAAGLAVGVVAWWFRRTGLQLTAATLALGALIISSYDLGNASRAATLLGVTFALIGTAYLVLSELDRLRPRGAATALGSIGLLVGIQAVALDHIGSPRVGLVHAAGTLAGLALIGVALWRRRVVLLGFGAAGIVIFLPQLLSTYFHNSIGITLTLLFAGVLLVAMSVFVIRLSPALKESPAETPG